MEEITVKRIIFGIAVFLLLLMLGSIATKNETAFKGIVTFFVVTAPFGVAWYINNTVEIRQRREKIKDYRPGQWTVKDVGDGFVNPSRIRLGVFGVQSSGKSSFLNSLHFAFKGDWEQVYIESSETSGGGETIFRDPARLNDHVTTFDTRGLVDLSAWRVPEVIAEICGERGINTRLRTRGEKIDCPIFILRYSPATGTRICCEFLMKLVPEIRQKFGTYPIMVVTFAKNISDKVEILDDIIRAGMEKNSVFFIENYTAENHEMNSKRHIELLQILEACIKRADDNVTFRWRTENERRETDRCEIM